MWHKRHKEHHQSTEGSKINDYIVHSRYNNWHGINVVPHHITTKKEDQMKTKSTTTAHKVRKAHKASILLSNNRVLKDLARENWLRKQQDYLNMHLTGMAQGADTVAKWFSKDQRGLKQVVKALWPILKHDARLLGKVTQEQLYKINTFVAYRHSIADAAKEYINN